MRTPEDLDRRFPADVQPGDYWWMEGTQSWWACTPSGEFGRLDDHEVIEHEDGTITVSPSILVEGEHSWHGYLERGVWRAL